jgi:hypothetical protein
MQPKAGTTQLENPVVQKETVSRPTPEQLSELACLLSKGEYDEPRALVKRALEIWQVANNELFRTQPYEKSDHVSFDEIAKMKMLPALRSAFGNVESGKGVGKTVDRYFKLLVKEYDQAMKGRQIDPLTLRSNKEDIRRLWTLILDEKQMPKRVLDLLGEFQINMRKKTHRISASEIREVLGGADVGTPSIADV